MAKANINSGLQLIPNDNKGRKFFTTSTVENQRDLKHTRIYEQIDEKTYNDIKLDDVKDSQGDPRVNFSTTGGARTYFRLIKDGENYSPYADEDLRRILEQGGNNSFTNQLETSAQDAIVSYAKTNNWTAETQQDSHWSNQRFSLRNVTGQAADFISKAAAELKEVNLNIEGKRRKKYDTLYYPESIASLNSKQDRIVFKMKYISGSRNINFNLENKNPLGLGTRNTIPITSGSVTLPIPGGISDTNNVKYENDSLDVIEALGFGALLNPIGALEGGVQMLGKALNSSPEELRNALGGQTGSNILSALRIRIAEMGMSRSNMFSRIGGGILNPNMELLFSAPGMRTFQFSFTMSARSQPEATQIKKIIRFFKQGMSVKRDTNQIFIVSPNTFTISYQLGNTGEDHPSIGRINDCALTNLNTTYGDGSTYMTFDDPDRTMTTYKMNMTFQELEPITEENYNNVDQNHIGF